MEIEKIYQQLAHIDRNIIKELYRTFKNYISESDSSYGSDEYSLFDYNKTNLAVAFGNLLAYEPDSITEFHYKQLESFFSKPELQDLYDLYEIILEKKFLRYPSAPTC